MLNNVDITSVFDVQTTLKQRWYNFLSTLFQRDLKFTKSYIETNGASDKYGCVNRKLNFILLNTFLQYINNSTTNKLLNYYSIFLTVVHIVPNGKSGIEAWRSSK